MGVLQIISDRDDQIGTKLKTQKRFLGLPTKPKTIPGPKLTPQKSHAEFPSLKNIQKALNDLIRKMKNNIMPRDTGALPVLDTDLREGGRGGGGGWSPKKYFFALWASVWSKINGGGRTPQAPPLDPPLSLRDTNVSYLFE